MSEKKKSRAPQAVAGAAIIAALLFGGNQLGLGNGFGFNIGDPQTTQQETAPQDTQQESSVSEAPGEADQYPDSIVVRVEEDKVYFNGEECADDAALKEMIEKTLTDERKFVLEEKDAIKYTYDWVIKTFDDLDVELLVPAQ
jgi:hypothetical protein